MVALGGRDAALAVGDLVEGKEYLFSNRGEADLKGFDEAVRLFEVRWQATPS